MYVGLSTADPTETGGGWADPTYTGYARKAVSFGAANARSIASDGVVTFDACTNGTSTVTHWGLWTADTGGTMMAHGQLSASKTIVAGNTPSIASGQITVSFNAGAVYTAMANKILDWLFRGQALAQPTNVKVALYTTTCADSAAGTECSGNDYAQVNCNDWDAATNADPAVCDNTSDITFPAPSGTWGTVVHAGLLLDTDPFCYLDVTDQAVGSGDTVKFLAGDLDVSLD